MEIVFVLLPLTLLLAIVGILGFAWALRKGQFEDVETPAVRILYDDVEVENASDENSKI